MANARLEIRYPDNSIAYDSTTDHVITFVTTVTIQQSSYSKQNIAGINDGPRWAVQTDAIYTNGRYIIFNVEITFGKTTGGAPVIYAKHDWGLPPETNTFKIFHH
ncbi:hypothetical protein [Acinetobacter baumannii]|uniref:hypothetical protein n=1 Tax=Acinetobacter baumannii TaxID=470 RepID=UPI0008066A47|nr:hypothetical protein [Acinetobacter baumannii]OIG07495.1 hypothetical protein A7M53_17825 [Acinetobacter baumannii]OIG14525.1 hypothetical protein A7M55_14705 [Acinetobacter baumannii]